MTDEIDRDIKGRCRILACQGLAGVSDGVCKVLPIALQSRGIDALPQSGEFSDVGVIAIHDDPRQWKLVGQQLGPEGPIVMRPGRYTISKQSVDEPDTESTALQSTETVVNEGLTPF